MTLADSMQHHSQKQSTAITLDASEIEELQTIALETLNIAHTLASQAEIYVDIAKGFSVNVRMGHVDTLEYHHDRSLTLTLYVGHKKASVSSHDLRPDIIREMVNKGYHMATHMVDDPCHGLAEAALMAKHIPDLSLYHPSDITPAIAIKKALACEKQALSMDQRIVNSEGVTMNAHQSFSIYANSHHFIGSEKRSRYSQCCVLIAKENDKMERSYHYNVARNIKDLQTLSQLATCATKKTIKRLNPRKLKTMKTAVIFEAEVAHSLLSKFLAAINGYNLYKKASFLLDSLNQAVFAKHINLYERPYLPKGLGSRAFDNEGVATREQDFICNGILQQYMLDSYTARQLKRTTTANSGGIHNLIISHGQENLEALLKKMNRGVLVTELIGQGTNLVTGDYSQGVSGFFVENGDIQYPVSEITVAGNLKDIYAHIVAVGNDINLNNNIRTGSILIESMTIAGN